MDTEDEDDRTQLVEYKTLLPDRSDRKRRQRPDSRKHETKTPPLTRSLLSHLKAKGPPKRRGIPIAIPSNPPPTPVIATPTKRQKIVNDNEPSGPVLSPIGLNFNQKSGDDSILIISDEERVQVSPLANRSKRTIDKLVCDSDKQINENIKSDESNRIAMKADRVQSSEEILGIKEQIITPTKRAMSDIFDEAAGQTPSKLVAKKAYIIQVPGNRLSKSPVEKSIPAIEQSESRVKVDSQEPILTSPQGSPSQGVASGHLTLPLKFLKIGTYECDGREQVVEISYRNQTLNFLADSKEICSMNIGDIFKLEYYDQNQPELLLLKTTHALENDRFLDSYNPDSYIDKKTRILCFFDSHSQFARLRRSLVVCVQPECEIFIQKREQWTSFIKEVSLDQPKALISPQKAINGICKLTQEKTEPESESIESKPEDSNHTPLGNEIVETDQTNQLQNDKKDEIMLTSDSKTTPRRSTRITKQTKCSPKPLSQDLFVYPFTGVNSITITGDDVYRLSDGEFLNDNLVEFYLKYFQNQLIESNPTLAEQVHFFNPFFYKRLTQKDKSNKSLNIYDKVKKWTSKINLFSKNYIFIPINENLHWYLALVCNPYLLLPTEPVSEKEQPCKTPERQAGKSWGPNSVEEIGDPNVEEILELDDVSTGGKSTNGGNRKWEDGSQSPWIVIFDSLGARHNTVFKTLNTYLINEAKEKLNTDIQNKAVGVYAKVRSAKLVSLFCLFFMNLLTRLIVGSMPNKLL
ncbi:hypothetical protein K7432_011381 [Basidiobolus ranarum]|uniref:Ubiquitin-like protease family profile domain-containing protein n=1 Tax=Basidiobolus ranarum TaxID=34480 RepID=A0ABR2VTY1_9FUNG